MSNIRGITFAEQTVTPADDAIVRRAMLSDGILSGCAVTYSGSTLTMASGYIIACGRAFQVTSAQNWAVVDATSGFARLLLTIDLTKTATEDSFNQVAFSLEYAAAEDGFVDLLQEDINLSGSKYQIVAAVVSLGTGGITGIVSKLERTEGGGGLNFKVVPGLTQPGTAAENTIWVKTQKISSWILSPAEPENPVEGMVWILVGDSGDVAFNALKKNGIRIYPLSAKQYVSGAWVDLDAMIYIGGQWVEWFVWDGELYDPGNEYENITGGWVAKGMKSNSSSEASVIAPAVVRTDTDITASSEPGKSGIFYTQKPIDITGYSSITFEGTFKNGSYAQNLALLVWSELGKYYADNVVARNNLGEGTHENVEMDISGLTAGSYYIGFAINAITGKGSFVKITKGKLKK